MARSEWSEYLSAGTYHSLQSTHTTDGDTALESTAADAGDAAEVLDQSSTDAPADGRIVTEWRDHDNMTSTSGAAIFGAYIRFQDASNWLMAQFAPLSANGNMALWLVERSGGGNPTLLDSLDLGSSAANITLSDGSAWSSDTAHRWVPFRVTVWEEGGSIYAEVEEDANRDGTWDAIGSPISSSAHSITSGGGVGVGSVSSTDAGGTAVNAAAEGFYIDATEVWYP